MIEKRKQLVEFSRELVKAESFLDGLMCISNSSKSIIHAQRCSIFIYDVKENEFWTTLADGIEKIVVPSDVGIIGYTLRVKKTVIENEPYNNPNFLSEIDMRTGFYTQNLIATPIFNSKREIIGIFELLNKEGGFDKNDAEFVTFFANYISGFIELNLF
jgi:hypothetical protein